MDEIQRHLEAGGSINISLALKSLRPGASWVHRGQEYSGLEWRDTVQEKPTEQEVLDEIERLNVLKDQLQWKGNRKKEYPSIEACVHAILDGQLDELQEHRQAVKAKYLKP